MDHTNITIPRGQKIKDAAFKALAAVGLIAVLTLVAWAGVAGLKNLPNAMQGLANVFVGLQSVFVPNEQLILSTDAAQIVSGKQFRLSFEHRGKSTDGSYAFFYECRGGLYFETPTRTGQTDTIFCNVPYNFVNDSDSVLLTPVAPATVADVPLQIRFTKNGDTNVSETGTLAVAIATAASGGVEIPPTSGTPTATTPPPGQQTSVTTQFATTTIGVIDNPFGRTDLIVRVLATGLVDRVSGIFTASSSIRSVDRAAVKFEVENIGNKTSGEWTFNAVLPTYPSFIFHSKQQLSLAPGDKIEFTLGFDSIKDIGSNTVILNADPIGSIKESNEENNIVQAIIVVKNP